MTYLLFALVIMLLCGIFIPYGIGEGIENVPLLIFILAVVLVVLIVKLIKYISVLVKAKNHLKNNGYEIVKFNILPPFFRKDKRHHIVAKKDGTTINVFVVYVSKSYLTYHFSSINTIELFKHTRGATKTAMKIATIEGATYTKQVGTKHLYWESEEQDGEINITLFNKFPDLITDTNAETGLGNGDKICNKIFLYNLEGFKREIK